MKHHVGAIPLPPSHDVAGEESGTLGLRNGERLRRLARQCDVSLRVEAEGRQLHPVPILLPVDHAATVLCRSRAEEDATAL